MQSVAIQIPDEIPLALKISQNAIGRELLLLAAVKLYEMGRLSSGAAARMSGIPRAVMQGECSGAKPTFRTEI